MEYKSNLPYPTINIKQKNIELANILLFVYAGNISEETAINLYVYESFVFNEIKDIMEQISIVEMHHLELLGETIKQLGIDPKFEINNLNENIKWSSNYINYPSSIEEALKINIKNETQAINNYNKIISLSNDDNVNNLLKRIILDEEIHLQIFKKLLKKTSL